MNEIEISTPKTALTPTKLRDEELLNVRLVFAHQESDGALQLPPDGVPWVLRGDEAFRLDATQLRTLFRGTHDPGEFGSEPPPEYNAVFAFLEVQLGRIVAARGTVFRDAEAVELFSAMRRRPDGRYQSPLYVYFRAALQVLLLVRPTSEQEFDTVLRRLERSGRTFSAGSASSNYYNNVLAGLLGAYTGA